MNHVKSFPTVLLFFAISVALSLPALAGEGNFSQCLAGCDPSDRTCLECCKGAFEESTPTACYFSFIECNDMCEGQSGSRALMCNKDCQVQVEYCLASYADVVQLFSCSTWVKPIACEECQTWSPVAQRCVNAPKEMCERYE